MKKTAIFISLLAMGAFVANAQDDKSTQTPAKTQNETKSSGSVNEQSPSNSPDVNSRSTSTSEGTMNSSDSKNMHGTKLQISDLPKVIGQNISSQHKGWTPKEVYKIDNQGAVAYEVVVNKNNEEMNLVYDANGNLLRTEQRSSMDSGTRSEKQSGNSSKSGTSSSPESTTSPTETK